MATDYTDQFYVMDPGNAPPAGSALQVQQFTFTDRNDNGIIRPGDRDLFEGNRITSVWYGDTVTVRIPGQGEVKITGVTFYVQNGPAVFTPTDGTFLRDATVVRSTWVNTSTQVNVSALTPPCFTPGTRIETGDGPRPVQKIAVGDLVRTADDGLQPVLWIGRARVAARGPFAPVRIARGALGNARALTVSQQHRILIAGWGAQVYAGQDAVLVPARHLVDGRRVRLMEGGEVTYLHLGFARHALVRSEGIWTESHFASVAARAEGAALFGARAGEAAPRLVRPAALGHESRLIRSSVLS